MWAQGSTAVSEEVFNKRRTELTRQSSVIVSPCMSIPRGREDVSHCSGEITSYEWDGDGQSGLSNGWNAYPSTEQHLFQCKFALVRFNYDDTSKFNAPVYVPFSVLI